MNTKFANLAIIFGGGTVMSPIALHALGSEASPPSIGFVVLIFAFVFVGGLLIFLWDTHARGEVWAKPSLSISLFGAGKQAQSQFISGLSLCWLGVLCMLLGGRGVRIEWVGALPLLIGLGLLSSVTASRWLFPRQFLD